MDRYFHDLDRMNDLHDLDQVDVLYARLERVEPPAGLAARVLARASARARRRRRIGYSIITACLALAAGLSFFVGQQLQASGALSLLNLMLADADLLVEAPLELVGTVAELVPWLVVIPIAACLVGTVVAMRLAQTPIVRFSTQRSDR